MEPIAEGAPNGGLSRHASRGFIWLLIATAGSRVVSLGGQIVLAWLLMPEDFGLIGLALTVTAFTSLLEQSGITEVLVRRQNDFARWISPAFWLALSLGLVSALVETALAPVAAYVYEEPRLVMMLVVLASSSPFSALQCVTRAVFLARLEFRMVALGAIGQSISHTMLTVVFAWMGYGAMSFVLPYPITAAGALLFQWAIAKPRITQGFRPREWKFLMGDTSRMLAASAVVMLTSQGDYMLLGVLQPAAVVGLYAFAFNMSSQAVAIVTRNVAKVLFPTLTKLQSDPAAQTRAYLSVASMLAIVGAPIAFMQAALADPILRLIFDSKWYPSIPFLQILSLGMVFRIVGSTAGSLLQAQGRFAFRLRLSVGYALLFFALLSVGYVLGEVIGLAMGVSTYYLVTGVVHPYLVTKSNGGRWSDILAVFSIPVGVATVSVGASALTAEIMFGATENHLGKSIWIIFGSLGLYALGLRMLARSRSDQIVSHLKGLIRNKAQYA